MYRTISITHQKNHQPTGLHGTQPCLLDLRQGEDQVVHQDTVGEERHHGGTSTGLNESHISVDYEML